MGCAASGGIVEVESIDPEALREYIARLTTLAKMPYLAIIWNVYDGWDWEYGEGYWPGRFTISVNGVDAEKIGPELVKFVQGFFPSIGAPTIKDCSDKLCDYCAEWNFKGKEVKTPAVHSMLSFTLVSRRIARTSA
jgi:hypothetical protein